MSDDQAQSQVQYQIRVPAPLSGKRLDQVASDLFPEYSRSRIQSWIKQGNLLVNSVKCKPNRKVLDGELLMLDAYIESTEWLPEDLPLDVVYQDADVLVLNKEAGLVVHPGAGNWSGTLLNALLHHFPQLSGIPRAGIVHRLDKETSGLMVVALSLEAQLRLVEQLQARSVQRTYLALVWGLPQAEGVIDSFIGRHPTQRTRMAVVKSGGKIAKTYYKRKAHFEIDGCRNGISLLELKLETGRTHQIRVHMSDLGFPLVGDPVYGKKLFTKHELVQDKALRQKLVGFGRQALHAKKLGFRHPVLGHGCEWESALPGDMAQLLSTLEGAS